MGNIDRELFKIDNEKKQSALKLELVKQSFASEIKSGLGETIKKNPRSVKIIKPSIRQRISIFLHKLFNRF